MTLVLDIPPPRSDTSTRSTISTPLIRHPHTSPLRSRYPEHETAYPPVSRYVPNTSFATDGSEEHSSHTIWPTGPRPSARDPSSSFRNIGLSEAVGLESAGRSIPPDSPASPLPREHRAAISKTHASIKQQPTARVFALPDITGCLFRPKWPSRAPTPCP